MKQLFAAGLLWLALAGVALAQGTGGVFPTPGNQNVTGVAALVPCGPIVNGQPSMCPPGLTNAVPVNVVNGMTAIGVIDSASNPVNGTIAVTNTFQTLLALNSVRKGCSFQNNGTHVMYVSVAASPTLANSEQVLPGNHWNCAVNGTPVVRVDLAQITGTATEAFAGDWQ